MTSPTSRPRPPCRYLLSVALGLVWLVVTAVVTALAAMAAFGFPGPLVTLVVAGVMGLVVGGFAFGFGEPDRVGAWRGARAGGWVFAATVVVIGLWSLLGGVGAALVTVALAAGCPATWAKLSGLRRAVRRRPQSDQPPGPGTVYGPAALRAAHEADLEARQNVQPTEASAPRERIGGVDMTAFEVALLQIEETGSVFDPGGVGDLGTGDTDAPSQSSDPAAYPQTLMSALVSGLVPAQRGPAETPEYAGFRNLGLDDLCTVWRRSSVLLRHGMDGHRLAVLLKTRESLLDELLRRHPAGTRAWMAALDHAGDDPRPFLNAGPGPTGP